jgi:hypothetical protein
VIDGSIDLGAAEPFAVLGSTTVTNTGPSVLWGDLGLSPDTSITGFPPGVVNGTVHATDGVAAAAQGDLTDAYLVAEGMTPKQSGLVDLTGLSLTPGVYSGGAMSVTGDLTLSGTAESVWVFQASTTLTIGPDAVITVADGASICNVFWQVGTSATLLGGAQFAGTVMAYESITAVTGATVTGRLLARTGAVTLDTNTVTAPSGCVTSSPTMTSSAPPSGEAGTPYSHTFTASGTPTSTFAVTGGTLPAGLSLNAGTGVMSGQPTTPGTSSFTITARNGTSPDAVVPYTVTIAAAPVVVTPNPPPVPPVLAPNPLPVPPVLTPSPPFGGVDLSLQGLSERELAERELAASGVDLGLAPWIAIVTLAGGALLLLARYRIRRSAR